jgi:hypothetical protein
MKGIMMSRFSEKGTKRGKELSIGKELRDTSSHIKPSYIKVQPFLKRFFKPNVKARYLPLFSF